jgi:exopolysaccharide biosynthesis protein
MLRNKLLSTLLVLLSLFNLKAYPATFYKQNIQLNNITYKVFLIEIEKEDKVTFVFPNKDKIKGVSSISNFIKNYKAKAAINGGFFKRDTQLPLGISYKDKKLLTGPLYKRSALIAYKNKSYEIKNLSFEGSIKSKNNEIEFQNINQPRLSKSQIIIYDKMWGYSVSSIFKGGELLLVENGRIIGKSTKQVIVPKNGYVIYGPADKLKNFQVGDMIDYSYSIPEISNLNEVDFIIGAGPKLIENGSSVNYIYKEKFGNSGIPYNARRSALGIKDGKLYLIAIPQGISVENFSKVLQKMNFDQAMGLDGGSSTQLYYKGVSYIFGALINNSIIVF